LKTFLLDPAKELNTSIICGFETFAVSSISSEAPAKSERLQQFQHDFLLKPTINFNLDKALNGFNQLYFPSAVKYMPF